MSEIARNEFLIATLGASAGGLEPLETFFKHMPAESGIAFVIVQHPAPDQPTALPELLARHTAMPVQQAQDNTAVSPNRVYIIPPNATLTITDGVLRVTPPLDARGHRLPIDSLFSSLAEDITERKQAQALLACQKQAFELSTSGASLKHVLEFFVRAVENQSHPGAVVTMHLLDHDAMRFHNTIAPGLPSGYSTFMNTVEVSSFVGPCCQAVTSGKRVIVEDISASKQFPKFAPFALPLGLRACWSTPIIATTGVVLGTVVEYYPQPRLSQAADDVFAEIVAHTAAIIIERKKADQALEESEERYRTLVSVITDMPWTAHADGRFVAPQPMWNAYTGQTWEESKDFGWANALHPSDRDALLEGWQRAAGARSVYESEGRIWNAARKEYRHCESRATPLLNEDGNVRGWVGAFTDIEEKRRSAAELRRTMEFDEAVMANMGEGLYTLDAEGCVSSMNPAAEELFGWTFEELRGKKMHDATHHHHRDGTPFPSQDCPVQQVLAQGRKLIDHEDSFIRRDGTFFDVVGSSTPLRSGNEIGGMVVVFRDVTERKRAEAALRASEARFRAAVTAHNSIMWTNNAQGEMQGEQPSWGAFTGQSQDEYQGYGWAKAVHPDDAQPTIDTWNTAVAERRLFTFEHRLRRNDGTWRLFSIRAAPVLDQQGNISEWVGVHDDITDERNLLIALRESETRFREVAELGPQFIWVALPDGTLEYVNERWTRYSGLDFTATADANRIARSIHPEDQEEMSRRWEKSLTTGEPLEIEARLRRVDGEFRWFVIRSVPLKDESGQITKWFGAATDIDEQKQVQEELRRANQDLEQFAYSASHDLQEPLRSVSIYSELLAQRHGGNLKGEALEFLGYLKNGASRMELLVHDLLAYTQVSKLDGPVEESDATTALSSVLSSLAEAIAESHAQITAGPLPTLRVHNVHLQQLFQNLIGNALKYRNKQQPVVKVAARMQSGYWLFSVSDNGIGVDPQYQERIFGLFKRLHTAEQYAGTGLGLAICQRIVERYHGRIWVESKLGEGSTFYFTLPG